jgi:nucleotide-binding universal stress UspA family protein
MSIRTILAAAGTSAACEGTIDLACRLASRFGSHVEGFHVLVDPRAVFAAAGEGFGMPIAGSLIDSILEEAKAGAAKAKALFETVAARYALPHRGVAQLAEPRELGPSVAWREETGHAPDLVAQRARFFDLAVLGRSDRVVREPHSTTIEETLMQGGRPVLLAPVGAPGSVGYVVAIAWNGSPQAVRALAASLPFLSFATTVTVLTVGDADEAGSLWVLDYLAWHKVKAEHRAVAAQRGRSVGQQLLDTAREVGADLLVMGAYGHAAWREFVFGGATREIVGLETMPLLLMH